MGELKGISAAAKDKRKNQQKRKDKNKRMEDKWQIYVAYLFTKSGKNPNKSADVKPRVGQKFQTDSKFQETSQLRSWGMQKMRD